MTALTYLDLTSIVETGLAATTAEAIIKNAIRELNAKLKKHNQELSNLTGTAGSMTVNLEEAEIGAVIKVAKSIYFRDYKGPTQVTVGSISYSTQRVEDVVAECARDLLDADVSFG
jgi:hypothetical protein